MLVAREAVGESDAIEADGPSRSMLLFLICNSSSLLVGRSTAGMAEMELEEAPTILLLPVGRLIVQGGERWWIAGGLVDRLV